MRKIWWRSLTLALDVLIPLENHKPIQRFAAKLGQHVCKPGWHNERAQSNYWRRSPRTLQRVPAAQQFLFRRKNFTLRLLRWRTVVISLLPAARTHEICARQYIKVKEAMRLAHKVREWRCDADRYTGS
jgi:hypothetical protein